MQTLEENKPIDITRLNRKQRRAYRANTGVKVMGRNLGYEKRLHGSYENYYKMRAEEIKAEEEAHFK